MSLFNMMYSSFLYTRPKYDHYYACGWIRKYQINPFCGIHLRAISQKVLINLMCNICLENTLLTLLLHFPGTIGLCQSSIFVAVTLYIISCHHFSDTISALGCLKSLVNWLFVQQLTQANKKKSLHYWPFVGINVYKGKCNNAKMKLNWSNYS